ncbi:MAG: LysR family transcriptional regulator [Xanthobacteraceae bacterium]
MDWADRVGRRIKLRDLHILLAVAESGSMSKASARLAISHPVVSKTISDLEHSLGVRLFDRGPQGAELTAYGKALANSGIIVFDEMRQGLKQIEFLANPSSGDLRIGCPDVDIAGIIPSIVDRFSGQYPGIRLQVIHANTSMMQFDELRGRNVELLIGRVPAALMEDDLALENLFTESLVAVTGLHSHWRRRRRLELADLIDEPWILPPYDSVRGPLIAEIFRANGLEPPRASVSTLSLQLTTTLIAKGRFVGFVPRSVARSSVGQSELSILPPKIPVHRIAVDVITIKNRTVSPLASLFIDCARKVAKPLTT